MADPAWQPPRHEALVPFIVDSRLQDDRQVVEPPSSFAFHSNRANETLTERHFVLSESAHCPVVRPSLCVGLAAYSAWDSDREGRFSALLKALSSPSWQALEKGPVSENRHVGEELRFAG